jgi:ABC-type antimicrobial peptide transport system permease subunit
LGAAGIALAIPLWLIGGRVLKTLLFGVTERDPSTLVLSLALLIAVAAAAGALPAWRAAHIDPTSAIRHE